MSYSRPIQLALQQFETLSRGEERLLDAVAQSQAAELSSSDPAEDSPARGDSWSDERSIRGSLLAWLLTSTDFTAELRGGIAIRGARIGGDALDLTGKNVPHRFLLDDCYFDHVPLLQGAKLEELLIRNSVLPGLNAGECRMARLDLKRGTTFLGKIDLSGAQIEGLEISDLTTSSDGMDLTGTNVNQDLKITGGCILAGPTLLTDANLGGLVVTGEESQRMQLRQPLLLNGARLRTATGLDIQHAEFDADLDLSRLQVRRGSVVIRESRLGNVRAASLTCQGLSLQSCQLSGSVFLENAVVQKATFQKTSAESIDATGLKAPNGLHALTVELRAELQVRQADLGSLLVKNLPDEEGTGVEAKRIESLAVSDCKIENELQVFKYELGALSLSNSSASKVDISHCTVGQMQISAVKTEGIQLHHDNVTDLRIRGAAEPFNLNMDGVVAERTRIEDSHLKPTSRIQRSGLNGAQFESVDLRGCELSECHLEGAYLVSISVDDATKIRKCRVEGLSIDLHTLESLEDYGGLTKGNRMSMDIRSGLAKLQASYSGFWQWVHAAAITIFLLPYVWFVLSLWGKSRFLPSQSPETIPLWEALARYIYSGGQAWQSGWVFHYSFVIFLYSLLYNVLRFRLLYETKTLELKQKSSGLPPVFSLEGSHWGYELVASRWGLWIQLILVASNSLHFMTQRVSLPIDGF